MGRHFKGSRVLGGMVGALIASSSFASTIYVDGHTEAGWGSASYTFSQAFSGSLVFGVADVGTASGNAKLIVDDIQTTGSATTGAGTVSNLGFELGNTNGYTPSSGAVGALTSASFNDARVNGVYVGTITVNPVEGSYLTRLDGYGSDMSSMTNTAGESGTDGSYLTTLITAGAGDSLSFRWNFFSDEPFSPTANADFSFFRLVATGGDLLGPGALHSEVLAQVGEAPTAIPLPSAVWLLLSGMGLLNLGLFSQGPSRRWRSLFPDSFGR